MNAAIAALQQSIAGPAAQAVVLVLLAAWLLRRSRQRASRPPGGPAQRLGSSVQALAQLAPAAVEDGRPLVLPLGRGGAGGAQAADSVAALALSRHSAGEFGAAGQGLQVVAGDATLWLASRQRLADPRFVGPDAAAFAAGVRGLLTGRPEAAAAPLGVFGDDYLLFAEVAAWQEPCSTAAAASPTVLPFLLATSTLPVLGGELYEAGLLLEEPSGGEGRVLGRLVLVLVAAILALAFFLTLLT